MRASIIIAAHYEGERLVRTVESVVESAAGLDCEVIVADDASDDGSIEETVRRFPRVRVVRHDPKVASSLRIVASSLRERASAPTTTEDLSRSESPRPLGCSPTKDLGARHARGDVLVFLDGHTLPDADAIRRLVEDVERTGGQAIITPCIVGLDADRWKLNPSQRGHGYRLDLETMSAGWLPLSHLKPVRRGGREFYESPAFIGCAFAISRELYDKLHGFDSHMFVWGVEDVDLALRCWLMGYSILHDPEPCVGHRFRRTFDNYEVPRQHVVANQIRMAFKCMSPTPFAEWTDRARQRYSIPLPDHPEGLFTAAWTQFGAHRPSAETERAHLHARRVHDELWYAERFQLAWPRLAGEEFDPGAATWSMFEGSGSPPPPSCEDHAEGDLHDGWDHWTVPGTDNWTLEDGVLTTPTGQRTSEVIHHVITNRSYREGFVLEIKFRFDSTQAPLFPDGQLDKHKHRPTFLGNSGIGVYGWNDGAKVIQLYEIQIADNYAMSEEETQRFLPKSQQTGYLRMNFQNEEGEVINQRHTEVNDLTDEEFADLLSTEMNQLEHYPHPDLPEPPDDGLRNYLLGPSQDRGWADCLCAVVSGLPVSYFKDVYLEGGGETEYPEGQLFPRPSFARWSEVGAQKDMNPIGGTEDPLRMTHEHRADYVKKDGDGKYRHFNHTDSDAWNTLWMCFRPARFDETRKKDENASFLTKVNGHEVFDDEVKTGTRSARRTDSQNPEHDLYVKGNTDKKIRILGHWGSKVMFKDVKIWSVGSVE